MNYAESESVQIITFEVDGIKYAVDILAITEIKMWTNLMPLPKSPDFLLGLINVRGNVIPVISFKNLLGKEESEITEDTRVMILIIQNEPVGIVVDKVIEPVVIKISELSNPPKNHTGISTEFIQGLYRKKDEMIIFLDIEKLLTESEKNYIIKKKFTKKTEIEGNRDDINNDKE